MLCYFVTDIFKKMDDFLAENDNLKQIILCSLILNEIKLSFSAKKSSHKTYINKPFSASKGNQVLGMIRRIITL